MRSTRRTRVWLMAIGICLAVAAGVLRLGWATGEASSANAGSQIVIPDTRDIDGDRVSDDIRNLARVWGEAGGTWAFPYWEKAYQRWRERTINDSTFREYVIAYREQLDPGCDVLAGLKLATNEGRQVANVVNSACDSRLHALDTLRMLLDARIEQPIQPEDAQETPDAGDDAGVSALEERFESQLQQSYHASRLAMNGAQALLAAARTSALPQDAFM